MASEFMCSEMIRVYHFRNGANPQECIAILEEISSSSACIQLESPVLEDAVLRLVCSGCPVQCEYQGKVAECRYREGLGYFARIEFELGSEWCIDRYQPSHLLNPASLAPPTARPSCDHCEATACSTQLMACSPAVNVQFSEHVANVAREVANLCGGMDEDAASKCFARLFQMSPHDAYFQEFYQEYISERRRIDSCITLEGEVRDRVANVLRLARERFSSNGRAAAATSGW